MEANTIYQKINIARQRIAAMQLSKDGKNAFAQYDYFTPELVQKMVDKGIEGLDIFVKFGICRDEDSMPVCTLTIMNADGKGPEVNFGYITEVPDVKATNAAQRYGALQTYAKRYMLMNAFNITDNTLDFDAQTDKRKDMSKATFDKIMTQLTTPDAKKKALEFIKQYKDSELTTKIIEACQK